MLPEASQLTGVALAFAAKLLEGLQVDIDRMRANLDAHRSNLSSEPLMRRGRAAGRQALRARRGSTRRRCAARDERRDLTEVLLADGLLSEDEVAEAMDPTAVLGAAGAFVDRVVARAEEPIHP